MRLGILLCLVGVGAYAQTTEKPKGTVTVINAPGRRPVLNFGTLRATEVDKDGSRGEPTGDRMQRLTEQLKVLKLAKPATPPTVDKKGVRKAALGTRMVKATVATIDADGKVRVECLDKPATAKKESR